MIDVLYITYYTPVTCQTSRASARMLLVPCYVEFSEIFQLRGWTVTSTINRSGPVVRLTSCW